MPGEGVCCVRPAAGKLRSSLRCSVSRSRRGPWRNPRRRFPASSRTRPGRSCPACRSHQERRLGHGPGSDDRCRGAIPGLGAVGAGSYTVTAIADGFQDRRRRRPFASRPGSRSPSRSRWKSAARGDGHRHEQLGADQHRKRHGRGDAELRSAHPHADADPQRAERRRVPARRQHDRHQPRLDDQRAAGRLPQHHARRREQQRQLPAQHRRVLRLGHAAAGRGRGRVGDARRRRRTGRRRRRRRDDGVPDAVGRQPLHRQRLRVLPEPELQLELLLQRGQSPGRRTRSS